MIRSIHSRKFSRLPTVEMSTWSFSAVTCSMIQHHQPTLSTSNWISKYYFTVSLNNNHLRCIKLLRTYVLGDKMIDFEFLSDQNQNFQDSFCHSVNYEDMNLNVSIPVFSIHGNHDDINGIGQLSSMDILSTAGLLNYFGKWRDLSEVEISPIVLKKNDTKIALYGLSHIHDTRLARLFRDHKVKVRKPDIPEEEIFNLMVLHQNRADRGRYNYLPEDKLPGFLDLVVWGHEHDCRIEPEPTGITKTYITQPGSSVATSLSEGESIQKKVGILEIHHKEFKMIPVKLKTVRPFIFRSVNIDEFVVDLRLNEGDTRTKVEKFYCKNVAEMIDESKQKLSGHTKQPIVPLIRLRIVYSDDNHMINTARFGQKYDKKVANPESLLAFKKSIKRGKTAVYNPDEVALKSAYDKKEQQDSVEDVVERYFNELVDEKDKLKLFGLKSLTEVCRLLVDMDDDTTASKIIEKHYTKCVEFLEEEVCLVDVIPDAIQKFQNQKSKDAFNEAVVENSRVKTDGSVNRQGQAKDSSDENEDDDNSGIISALATRGKPVRGKGSRGGLKAATRGRAKKTAPSADDSGSSSTRNIKKGRGSARQATIAAFSSQRSQGPANKSASIFISDSDSD